MTEGTRERIELLGGWSIEIHEGGDQYLKNPFGRITGKFIHKDARAFAAAMASPAKAEPARSDVELVAELVSTLVDENYGNASASDVVKSRQAILDRLAAKDAEIATLNARIADYEVALADKRRLTRELDVALHGESGAAKQASLCDLIEPAKAMRAQIATLTAVAEERAGYICGACGQPWTGDKCGQFDNGWPHQVCYPVAASSVTTGDPHTASPRPFQTYPEDRAKLLKLCDDAEAGKDFAAEELFDLVRAILTCPSSAGDTTEGR